MTLHLPTLETNDYLLVRCNGSWVWEHALVMNGGKMRTRFHGTGCSSSHYILIAHILLALHLQRSISPLLDWWGWCMVAWQMCCRERLRIAVQSIIGVWDAGCDITYNSNWNKSNEKKKNSTHHPLTFNCDAASARLSFDPVQCALLTSLFLSLQTRAMALLTWKWWPDDKYSYAVVVIRSLLYLTSRHAIGSTKSSC